MSCAGLVPVMGLAERTGLAELIGDRVWFKASKVASAGVNPAGKLTAIIAGMVAGADSIDDLDLLRCGGMARLFTDVYAPATLGQHLREFSHGHALQLASVLRAHLVTLVGSTGLLPGISQRVFVDIDSLLRPTFGHANKAPATATPRSPENKSSAGACHRWRRSCRPRPGAGDRRDPAPRRPGRLGGARLDGHRRHRCRPRCGRGRRAHGPRRFRLTVTVRSCVPASEPGRGSRWSWSRTRRSPRRSPHSRRRLGPVHYPGAVPDPETGEWIVTPRSPRYPSSPRSSPPGIQSPPG